jgi:hypothetical protein
MFRAYNDIDLNCPKIQLPECLDYPSRTIHRVSTAKEHEYIAYNTGARLRLSSRAAKLLPQNGISWPQKGDASVGYLSNVSPVRILIEILVDEHITIMTSISQIVQDEHTHHRRPQFAFPKRVERVVIDDEPVTRPSSHRRQGLARIFFLRYSQPFSVCAARTGGQNGSACVDAYQLVPLRNERLRECFGKVTAYETGPSSPRPQGVCKRETAHEMTGADLARSIYANKDIHGLDLIEALESGMADRPSQ